MNASQSTPTETNEKAHACIDVRSHSFWRPWADSKRALNVTNRNSLVNVRYFLLLIVILGAFSVLPSPTEAATTTIHIQIDDIASTTSLFRFPSIPDNAVTVTYWQMGLEDGTNYDDVTGGVGGTGGPLSSWHNGDNSIRLDPIFQDPIIVGTYKGYIKTATDTYLINPFEWNGTNFNVSSSTTNPECDTCSRIISTDPTYSENVGTAPVSVMLSTEYYLTDEDFNEDGDEIIEYQVTNVLCLYQNGCSSSQNATYGFTLFSGTHEAAVTHDFDTNGTYNVSINMYRQYDPPFWQFWADSYSTPIDSLESSFIVGSSTSQTDVENVIIQSQAPASPTTEAANLSGMLDRLLHTPPIGYATIIVQMFNATNTSTSTGLVMTYTVPDGMPGAGGSLTLDLPTTIENSISYLNAFEIESFGGANAFDKFMTYWNLLWYGGLMFWIVSRVFGTFNFDLVGTQAKQQSGTIPVRSAHTRKRLSIDSLD